MLTETNNNDVEDIEIIEKFHMLKYSHKTYGGQSGNPLFIEKDSDTYDIYGFHVMR